MTRKGLENERLIGPCSVAHLMPSKEYSEKSITSQMRRKTAVYNRYDTGISQNSRRLPLWITLATIKICNAYS